MAAGDIAPVLVATLVVGGVVAGVLLAAAEPVAADEHTRGEATDYTEEANFTISLPERTDHYPGDSSVHGEQDGHNASIEYFAAGGQAFREVDAEEGAFLDMIILEADFIDYSECDAVRNTKAFGIDRGNNNSGTRIDEDLIQYRESSSLEDGKLTIDFSSFDGFNEPPYMAPEDAVVAAQGVGSRDGPCLKMTSDPGWYRIEGFINGTEADNGPDEEPSDDANRAGILAQSNYVYICECDSEQEAREELGPPPNEDAEAENGTTDGDSEAATPTDAGGEETTSTSVEDTPTPTPLSTDAATPTRRPETPTPTRDDGRQAGTGTPTGKQSGQVNQRRGQRNQQQDRSGQQRRRNERNTPTIGEGPGFTPVVALVAVLAAALLVTRRR